MGVDHMLARPRTVQVDPPYSSTWQMQLCFERVADKPVAGRATLAYDSEYEGVPTSLVISPFTDRCWMTLTAALAFFLGGAPAGAAGDLSNDPLCALNQSAYKLKGEDFKEVCALARVLKLSP